MTDPHINRRASMCLIAFVVGSTLSAAAQTRTSAQMDVAITQQQTSLEQLTASVAQLQKDNAALKNALAAINKSPAPPEAWNVLGTVGLVSVLAWGAVTLLREWSRTKETQAEMERQRWAAIDQQAKSIESAANARIKALADLLREARASSTHSAEAKGAPGFVSWALEWLAGSGTGRSKGAGS